VKDLVRMLSMQARPKLVLVLVLGSKGLYYELEIPLHIIVSSSPWVYETQYLRGTYREPI